MVLVAVAVAAVVMVVMVMVMCVCTRALYFDRTVGTSHNTKRATRQTAPRESIMYLHSTEEHEAAKAVAVHELIQSPVNAPTGDKHAMQDCPSHPCNSTA